MMQYSLQLIFISFILHVFLTIVKSEKPQCQAPVLVQYGTTHRIKIVCTAQNDYPEGSCNFTIKGPTTVVTFDKTVRHPGSTASTGSYTTECELLVPVEGLDEGSYQFQIEVFPSQQSLVNAPSSFSEWTSGIVLQHTRVFLDPRCAVAWRGNYGYIMAGTATSCGCVVTQAGSPPGYAQWYTSEGEIVGTNHDDGSCDLSLDIKSEGKTYYCTAMSVLKMPQTEQETQFRVPYNPKFAIGPKQVFADYPEVFNNCSQGSDKVRLKCEVPTSLVTPSSPLFTLIIGSQTVINRTRGNLVYNADTDENVYEILHFQKLTAGSNLRFLCRAENPIFPDQLRTEEEFIIQIREPPQEAPVLRIMGNQPTSGTDIAYVRAGSDVLVSCRVNGGVPDVDQVTIMCGALTKTQDSSSAALSLKLPKDFSGVECTCSASHITGCYDKRTQIILLRSNASVSSGDSVSNDDSDGDDGDGVDTLSIGIGVGIGLAFLIITVGTVVFLLKCRNRDKPGPPRQDIGYIDPVSSTGSSSPYPNSESIPGSTHTYLDLYDSAYPSSVCSSDPYNDSPPL